jgi:hypothetical protein
MAIFLIVALALGLFVLHQVRKCKREREANPQVMGQYRMTGIDELTRQALSRLGTLAETTKVKNERFIALLDLWNIQNEIPPFLRHAVLRKVAFEIKRLHVPDPSYVVTVDDVFRKLSPDELQEFHQFCVTN